MEIWYICHCSALFSLFFINICLCLFVFFVTLPECACALYEFTYLIRHCIYSSYRVSINLLNSVFKQIFRSKCPFVYTVVFETLPHILKHTQLFPHICSHWELLPRLHSSAPTSCFRLIPNKLLDFMCVCFHLVFVECSKCKIVFVLMHVVFW